MGVRKGGSRRKVSQKRGARSWLSELRGLRPNKGTLEAEIWKGTPLLRPRCLARKATWDATGRFAISARDLHNKLPHRSRNLT